MACRTGQSLRPTIVNAIALGEADLLPIQLQGNWADTKMVKKYLRDKSGIALPLVRRLAAELKIEWEKEDEATRSDGATMEPQEGEPARERQRTGAGRGGPGAGRECLLGHRQSDGKPATRQGVDPHFSGERVEQVGV